MAIVWVILVVAGLGSILVALDAAGIIAAVEVGFAWAIIWTVVYAVQSHLTGIKRLFRRHFGPVNWLKAAVITRSIPRNRLADFQMALDHLHDKETEPFPVIGLSIAMYSPNLVSAIQNNAIPVPVEWKTVRRSLSESMQCATNAVYFLTHEGKPYCAFFHRRQEKPRRHRLQVLAKDRETAQSALSSIFRLANQLSVYRGAIVSLQKSKRNRGSYAIHFHKLQDVTRDDIVLPEELMQVLDRNVLGFLAHRETLRDAGQNTRRGLLLYGPPGTGKTHVVRYLAKAVTQTTVILLTGRQVGLIRESCQLARLLSPSLVVFEDVDLVAGQRDQNRRNTLLHELMDEMDGMGGNTDCIFLLTTNRPDLLESALAGRPGRVDQAICFPLPDREQRRRLFALFGKDVCLDAVDLSALTERTDGATPAFIKELFRKAVLLAAGRGEKTRPMRLNTGDFEAALHEMLVAGGELTQRLLGLKNAPVS